jgi:hypothetical protein
MDQEMTVYGSDVDPNYSSIGYRLALIIQNEIQSKNLHANLEERTGIPRDTWRQWLRKQFTSEPSSRLIQGAALEWPHYAFWLITGYADPTSGHISPVGAKTGRHTLANAQLNKKASELARMTRIYFKESIDLIRKNYGKSNAHENELSHIDGMWDLEQKKLNLLWTKRSQEIIEFNRIFINEHQKN